MRSIDCPIVASRWACVLGTRFGRLVTAGFVLCGCAPDIVAGPSIGPEAAALRTKSELSDPIGLERMTQWESLALLPDPADSTQYLQRTSRDRGIADPALTISLGGNRDYNNFVCRSSDAAIGHSTVAPYRFDESSCREPYVKGAVLARFEGGSGRLARAWLTALSALDGVIDDEVIRVYVDDVETPVVDERLNAVMDGSAGEMFAPPFGAGSPKRLSWYYPVTFNSKLIIALDELGDEDYYYHNFDVVFDDVGAVPEAALHEQRALAVSTLRGETLQDPASVELVPNPPSGPIAPDEFREIAVEGPHTLRELRLNAPAADYTNLAGVRVRVTYDDAVSPAIDTTVAQLFGGALPPEVPSLAMSSTLTGEERNTSLRLPIPFEKNARFRFDNVSGRTVTFGVQFFGIAHDAGKPLPAGFGYLHVQSGTTSASPASHVAAAASGRGRLAGVCARIAGHADLSLNLTYNAMNFLEGDVRAHVDGMLALDGTGTEDYSDDVFYFEEAPIGNPFVQAGALEVGTTQGAASLCRWQVLSTELDFQSSLELSFELGGVSNPEIVDQLDTVAYLYRPAPSP